MDRYGRILEELNDRAIGKPQMVETVPLYKDLIPAQACVDVSRCESKALAYEMAARLPQASEPAVRRRALKEVSTRDLGRGMPDRVFGCR
jgi:hypothetical protein